VMSAGRAHGCPAPGRRAVPFCAALPVLADTSFHLCLDGH